METASFHFVERFVSVFRKLFAKDVFRLTNRDSDFVVFVNYYGIQIKRAERAIHFFHTSGTPKKKFYYVFMFCIFEIFFNF